MMVDKTETFKGTSVTKSLDEAKAEQARKAYIALQPLIESKVEKVRLGDIAEVFRGKAITKDLKKPGEFLVLNIVNIVSGEINYENMESVDWDDRKMKRHLLEAGDLLITCRGTVVKIAVFEDIGKKVIASSNIIVVRLKKGMSPRFLKLFLESPVGETILKSVMPFGPVLNLSPGIITHLMIPVLPMRKQELLVKQYEEELNRYQEALRKMNETWSIKKEQIYKSILEV